MNDREFDALLESAAPELPPDDVARDVTPWRRAIGNILGGSALCSITLNFLTLNYLLPAIGDQTARGGCRRHMGQGQGQTQQGQAADHRLERLLPGMAQGGIGMGNKRADADHIQL